MSYSVCKQCEQMVPCYEKYCRECVYKFPCVQIEEYWSLPKEDRDRLDKEESDLYHHAGKVLKEEG